MMIENGNLPFLEGVSNVSALYQNFMISNMAWHTGENKGKASDK